MKLIKKWWNSNRVLFVLVVIIIICFLIMGYVFIWLFFGGGTSKYGDRLESISDLPLTDELTNEITSNITESESVTDVSVSSQGKIIYIRIVYENVTVERAKEIASGSLSVISDEYLANYDIHYTLVMSATENSDGFIVMGAKNIGESQIQIVWASVTTTTYEDDTEESES